MGSIAVILPCHNEGPSIAKVIGDFRKALPTAHIYVFDNNSTDDTSAVAKESGATVIFEPDKGKGNVVRRAFSEVEADIYVMADGDGTYDVTRAGEMIDKMASEHLDMVVGVRCAPKGKAYRRGHRLGNTLFNHMVRTLFGDKFTDIFSGYRVFSRRFVKSFPALSTGFEIETEISIHAIQLRIPTGEIETEYFERQEGSTSKLNTYRDGFRILLTLAQLFKNIRPFAMFTAIAAVLVAVSLGLGLPIVFYFLETATVPKFPTAIAAASLMVLGAISFITGIILDSITHANATHKRLFYLSLGSFRDDASKDS